LEAHQRDRGRRGSRRRLVRFFLLIFILNPQVQLFPADSSPQSQMTLNNVQDFPLITCLESELYRPRDIYSEPLIYLCFLPGLFIMIGCLVIKRKKAPLVLVLFLWLSFLCSASEIHCYLFDNGLRAYSSGDYESALKFFIKTEEHTGIIPALCYNKALCYYRLGRKGHAINQLYKAIKQAPLDTSFRKTLSLIEKSYGLYSQYPPGPFIHSNIPFLFIIIFFNCACIFLGLVFRLKKGSLFIVFIFLTVITIGFVVVFIVSQVQMNETVCTVVTENGILKKIPLSEAKTWIVLKEGTTCKVLDKAYGYVLVNTGRGLKGWIQESNVVMD
jgi:hypothetical protein